MHGLRAGRTRIDSRHTAEPGVDFLIRQRRRHFCRSGGRNELSTIFVKSTSFSSIPTPFIACTVFSRRGISIRPSLQNFAATRSLTMIPTSFGGRGA